MKCLSLLLLSLLLFSSKSQAASPTTGCGYFYAKQQWMEAVEVCRADAINGKAVAKYYLGLMYANGEGVSQNLGLAGRMIREAAQLEVVEAQVEAGFLYHEGRGVEKDLNKACDWWEMSAAKGSAKGQERAGICYLMGEGRERDLTQGYALLSLAADKGSSAATYILSRYAEKFPPDVRDRALELAKGIEK